MHKLIDQGRTSLDLPLVLKGSEGVFADLITVRTAWKYKRELVEPIRSRLKDWMQNPGFDDIRNKPLDLAIVIRRLPKTMRRQDVDNIAKRVLDAMKKDKKNNDPRFLFHDDEQIARLLVWKIGAKKLKGWNTDSLEISFRVHDSREQMLLEELREI